MRALLLPLAVALLAGCSTSDQRVAEPLPTPSTASLTPTPTRTVAPSPTATPKPSATRTPAPGLSPSARASASGTYRWSVRRVSRADLPHSWHPGCPVGPSSLRLLSLPYRDFSGARRTGELVVNARVVPAVVEVFRSLYAAGFPIRSMRSVDEYGGSDDRSMDADNTSAFNCRDAVGGSGWSQHAYGLAIDVNPIENPYLYGGEVLPPAGAAYTDRSRHRRGMAYRGSTVNRAFAAQGWSWGGVWRNPDYQHFSTNGK